MKFELAIIEDVQKIKSDLIELLSGKLANEFKDKHYGSSIKSYTIGVVCVRPEFEQFFKNEKPSYTKGKKIINPDGIPFEIEDSFEYDIKLNLQQFKNASEDEANKILETEILKSLKWLDDMKNKIKDFDSIQFKKDLEDFFKNRR